MTLSARGPSVPDPKSGASAGSSERTRRQVPLRVELQLSYCAWMVLAPQSLARYTVPELEPWFACFVDAVRAPAEPRASDRPGQHLRRELLRAPADVRGRALLVESSVRTLSIERLAAFGTPAAICRALGCQLRTAAPKAWERDLAAAFAA